LVVTRPEARGLSYDVEAFDQLIGVLGPRVRMALVSAYGVDVGTEATAEALAYAWEHRSRITAMDNPAGYLYRVGQTAARRQRRWGRPVSFPMPSVVELPEVEPALGAALAALPESQRVCVVLVHAFGWTHPEVGALLGVRATTVRTHVLRGMAKLRARLEVTQHAG